MEPLELKDDFKPRDYQISIMEIAIKQNTIIFLPTGAGKTLIAVMILKHLSKPLQKPFSQGGKLSIMIVNTVALVDQQAKYLRSLTDQDVGAYSGEMNVDSWDRKMWEHEFETHQVLVMTAQILINLLTPSFLSLNQVNLLIFDECHNAVKDHAMRQVMVHYQDLVEEPRVIGLSATLLNKNCKPAQVMSEVNVLETTFRSKIATVEDLELVIGYSTNPMEDIRSYKKYELNEIDMYGINDLRELISILQKIRIKEVRKLPRIGTLTPLDSDKEFKDLIGLINDIVYHIETFGTYIGELALVAHTIQLERIKKNCQDPKVSTIYDAVMTTFITLKKKFSDYMNRFERKERIFKCCSDQVLKLFEILKEFKCNSKQPLCGIVFVQRRFTAKLIYNVLKDLKELDCEFDHIEPNFIVGFNTNPFIETREGLYKTKMNKKVLNQFRNKEINLLVSSNVLEEGVDIPMCTLVISFDKLQDYRGYIQSKGRARHKDSYFYMMVENYDEFIAKYHNFKEVEKILNDHLVGANDSRCGPCQEDLVDDQEVPPYYVNGPGSPKVDLLTAIPLLCRYCLKLPSDKYTTYTPNWFVETRGSFYRVVLELPTVSTILERIEGPFMSSKKQAKRAAALKACEILHKCGELDDQLLPRKVEKVYEDLNTYFTHWPDDKEKIAGSIKKRRLHSKQIPKVCRGPVLPNVKVFLHIIEIRPLFSTYNKPSDNMIHQLYSSDLCFGLISAQSFPKICKFPLFVSAGEISINIKENYKTVVLTEEEVECLRSFHCLVFDEILKVLKPFLVIDNDGNVDGILVAPVLKESFSYDIHFEVAYENKEIIDGKAVPSYEEKKGLHVREDNYLGKIVTPWYRSDDQVYVVTRVCLELNECSRFPSDEFKTYKSYYKEKYDKDLVKSDQPLLLVKSLSKRLNCLKPRYSGNKRGREKIYEDVEEHLIPELCVKQEMPAALWIQAMLLPSILYRTISFLQAEELRYQIAFDSGLGVHVLPNGDEWSPLVVDKNVVTQVNVDHPKEERPEVSMEEEDSKLPITEMRTLCQDFAAKKLNNEFPWDIEEEPKDIERNLDVTLTDVQYFEYFISQRVPQFDRMKKNEMTNPTFLPALTFDKSYIYQELKLLQPSFSSKGPELVDIFTALATAKNNDIVDLERLETLGDSFLKLSISLFVILKYPNFDEGRLTSFKGQLISNKNLYYIGKKKNIPGYLKVSDFTPTLEWKPPSYHVPTLLLDRINSKEISINSLFNFGFSKEEKISGTLSIASETKIINSDNEVEDDDQEEVGYDSMHSFLDLQIVSDKTVADGVEALIGVYFQCYGFDGGLKLLKWLEIVPRSENIDNLLSMKLPNPVLDKHATEYNIDYHLPFWKKVEEKLGYTFNNRAYLLQALTHSSYTPNRITNCYQTLEFLGDAVLDFLITCHIYETCQSLDPGELTDLRSALVNNVTFAGFTVRCGFQKYLLFSNNQLLHYIDNFVHYQESRNFEIGEEVLILLEENDMCLAEHIDVPKVLGDTFEALVGAVFLDSGMCLETVWKVIHPIMWKEIELFKNKVPKNAVRLIHETVGAHPKFDNAVIVDTGATMVGLGFILNGAQKKVYGFGENKALAKKAAAKIALRLMYKC